MPHKTYFFCGVGGSGMSPLANIMKARGYGVRGSDRSYDRGQTPEKFENLQRLGIELFPQDGSGVTPDIDALVVSSAVEETIPDVQAALNQGVRIIKRAELLAQLANVSRSLCVGGTSGKTTVTGMIGHILMEAGCDPTVMNGGIMINAVEKGFLPGNAVTGEGDWFVTETDESDGSIALFNPDIAVLTNLTLDHKSLEELRKLFCQFLQKSKTGCVVNLDDPESRELIAAHPVKTRMATFGINNESASLNARIDEEFPHMTCFTVQNIKVNLPVPGHHNVSNALAAMAAALFAGVSLEESAKALASFKGIKRRMNIVGTKNDITVIDDFGHNPDKIAATLSTLRQFAGRVLAVFQPHGFRPTAHMKDELIDSFARHLNRDDVLLMPEIYYAGGTTEKIISSADIIQAIKDKGHEAYFFETRDNIVPFITKEARPGDRIVIMGARDDTLTEFAQDVLDNVAG